MRQPALFDPPPRRKPRVMMHVTDAGHADGIGKALLVHVKCGKCGHNGWWTVDTVTQGRRGVPCPVCNPRRQL